MSAAAARTGHGFSRMHEWTGYLLGFAIGGFFDGILLHQILQWHHLLSGFDSGAFGDLRTQVVADGAFHLVMYAVGLTGLWMLWHTRREFAATGAARFTFANVLIGFGAWHIIDAVLVHWILQLHRIMQDSAIPLLWDLIWVIPFGLGLLAAGVYLRARGDAGGGTRAGTAPAVLAAVVVLTGAWASLPPTDSSAVVVVFRPGVTPAEAMAAMAAVDGRLVWTDPAEAVWAMDLPEGASALELYRHGALLVGNGFLPAGCLDWVRL